jgi:hypothetical protein
MAERRSKTVTRSKRTSKPSKRSSNEPTTSTTEQLTALSAIAIRASIAGRMGKSFAGDRDVYEALGYKKNPDFNDYMARYRRQDIAKAIIDVPVKACWRLPPRLTESKDEDTELEKAWTDVVRRLRVTHYFSRVDRLARVGSFAILLLGFDDGEDFDTEIVSSNANLLYMMPYSQANVSIKRYVDDTKNERFGLPDTYDVTFKHGESSTMNKVVHHSRVIHVAEDMLEDNVEGRPKLEGVLNRLHDLEIIVGGSAEMFWRGALPGYGFKLDEGHSLSPQDLEDLQSEIEEYLHGLKRYIRLRGMSVEDFAVQVADPSNHVSVQLDMVSAETRIPKRILLGSERGELASSQDEQNWLQVVDSRRNDHCEMTIVRPFIDRLIAVGALPSPRSEEDGYGIDWPDLKSTSDKDAADIASKRSSAIKDYATAVGADDVVPPEIFLREIMGFSDDTINEINEITERVLREEGEPSEPIDEENEEDDTE